MPRLTASAVDARRSTASTRYWHVRMIPAPACVRCTPPLVRSNKSTPSRASIWVMVRLSVDCLTPRASAAFRRLPNFAAAVAYRRCLISMDEIDFLERGFEEKDDFNTFSRVLLSSSGGFCCRQAICDRVLIHLKGDKIARSVYIQMDQNFMPPCLISSKSVSNVDEV